MMKFKEEINESYTMAEAIKEAQHSLPAPGGADSRGCHVAANNIIMAIGATPNTKIVRTTSGLENDERRFLITRDLPYCMTTRKGVFAGGDVANRQATVVHAMQDAKKVAMGIAQYVDAVKLMQAIG